jgi:hypothetical protein
MKQVMRSGLGRSSAAAAPAVGARFLERGLDEGGYHATRSRRSTQTGAVLAFTGPAAVTANRIRRRTVSLAPPPSAIGKAMLGSYVLASVPAEELAWRKVLTFRHARVPRTSLTLVSMAGFVLAHVPRETKRANTAEARRVLVRAG